MVVGVAEPDVAKFDSPAQARHWPGVGRDRKVRLGSYDVEVVLEEQQLLVCEGGVPGDRRHRGLHTCDRRDQQGNVACGDPAGRRCEGRPQQGDAGYDGGHHAGPRLQKELVAIEDRLLAIGGPAFVGHAGAKEGARSEQTYLLGRLHVGQQVAIEDLTPLSGTDTPEHVRTTPGKPYLGHQRRDSRGQDQHGHPSREHEHRTEETQGGHGRADDGHAPRDHGSGRGAAGLECEPQPVQELGLFEACHADEALGHGEETVLGQ
ncbi:hypothetical protein SUDANB52_08175 (plasmid) [Streptomyces sp. SudanB52_2052]